MRTPKSPARSPLESKLKPGLVGRCFITLDERGHSNYQGVIHAIIPSACGDLVLVQYFEWGWGELNTMALVPLTAMVRRRMGPPFPEERYVLFEDDAHLRDYLENVQRYKDERIDADEARKRP